MLRRGPNRKGSFLWQGALILLPVAMLAAVGFFSLRRDKILARQEASQRAQALADDLLQRIWSGLAATKQLAQPQAHTFQVDESGQLLFPPPAAPIPVPSSPATERLNPEQLRLWRLARTKEIEANAVTSALQAWRDFVESNPPAEFAGPARYALGLVLAKTADREAAARMFRSVVERYPDAVGESGLPLGPLAQLKLVELGMLEAGTGSTGYDAAVTTLCSNLVHRPTILTPHLLSTLMKRAGAPQTQEEIGKWEDVWQGHEETRELFAAAAPHFPAPPLFVLPPSASQPAVPLEAGFTLPLPAIPPKSASPSAFWFDTASSWRSGAPPGQATPFSVVVEGRDWLAMPYQDSALSHWFLCLPGYEVTERVTALLAAVGRIPDYLGVSVEVAGRRLTADLHLWQSLHYMTKGGGGEKKQYLEELATEILGSAVRAEGAAPALRINVFLTSPSALFEAQRNRTFWFGSLIAASALAALVGLVAAYRAFQRQLRLSEMKSNFVSSVSHELRAPIASVRLMAESLERGRVADTPKQQEYFRFIGQECRRLSSLIENVLDFSRIDQGRKQYEFEPTDLVALTRQTVTLMETYAAERQVQLRFDDSQLSTFNHQPNLDGRAIQQALINLIDNAIKHSPKGETVRVGLEVRSAECGVRSAQTPGASGEAADSRFTPDASRITLWVEDHGEGIPAAEHEKIFERFYRVGSELRRETQGVGIGLSLVKHAVEAHGGRVVVRSAVGEGSRFTIELPLRSPGSKSEIRSPKSE